MIPAFRRAAPGAGTLRTGTGFAPCHHGEVLQGVFLDGGVPRPGLVTLPMAGPGSRAAFVPRPGTAPDAVTVSPAGRSKATRAAVLAVTECARTAGLPPCGGELRLTGDVPVGLGMGSSTSDVLAALRAVADAYAVRMTPGTAARLAVLAEKASDPLMLDDARPVLFAQREGRVLEVLGPALPPLLVVGCALGGGSPVDTLSLPAAEVGDSEVRAWERLRGLLRRAVATGDAALVGEVATASARRGQLVLGHPEFDDLCAIARRAGAVGVQIAHSGAVAGVLFDPWVPDLRTRVRRCVHDLQADGIPTTRTFTTTPAVTVKELLDGPAHRRGDRPAGPDPARRPARVPAL